MFLKHFHLLFLSTLITGTIIAVSADSWFTSWLGLEINLMSMIPLMLIKVNSKFTESAIKYFLTQAMASLILILSAAMNLTFFEYSNLEVVEMMMIFSLSMKAGLAPLHFWFPQIANKLKWLQCLIVFTWQKIAPLVLICSLNFKLVSLISILSAVVGALGGFNQMILKLIMTYSSISHSGWMVMNCLLNFNTWLNYFVIYSFLSLSIILFFFNNKINTVKNIFTNKDSLINKSILLMNMLSLGGLPPLLGFAAKLSVLMSALKMKLYLIFTILISSSIISLFYYTRIIYTNMININKTLIMPFTPQSKNMYFFFSLSVFLNISAPASFILF